MIACSLSEEREAKTLSQESYVWQRVWTEERRREVNARKQDWDGLYTLVVEVDWQGDQPVTSWVDSPPLTKGVVLRIWTPPSSISLSSFLGDLIADVRERYPSVEDIQIDLDMPTRHLCTYYRAVQEQTGVTSVTVLPTWIGKPCFRKLVGSVDDFVLQVHGFEPTNPDTLLFPNASLYVEQVDALGIPFRVALPTYGYSVHRKSGRITSVFAEERTDDIGGHSLSADAQKIAALVRTWKMTPPKNLHGLIWFRLPMRSDKRNWPYPTLMAVRAGREPSSKGVVSLKKQDQSLWDISVKNTGEAIIALPNLCISSGILVADALQNYRWENSCFIADGASFRPETEHNVGWVRASTPPVILLENPHVFSSP
ncbi:MAG: DUF3142 domain-containing protein [Myxococcota bacterium]|nr:DUF3142 domain-containing protein [Myxococcota bacterium]